MNIDIAHGRNEEWGAAEIKGSALGINPIEYNSDEVPDLVGMGARDAVFAIENRGMKAIVNGVGRVKKQSVPAGQEVKRGEPVVLELGR